MRGGEHRDGWPSSLKHDVGPQKQGYKHDEPEHVEAGVDKFSLFLIHNTLFYMLETLDARLPRSTRPHLTKGGASPELEALQRSHIVVS